MSGGVRMDLFGTCLFFSLISLLGALHTLSLDSVGGPNHLGNMVSEHAYSV